MRTLHAPVVVVGGTGLLGHVLIDVLTERGHVVRGVRGGEVLAQPDSLPIASFIVNASAWIPRDSTDEDEQCAVQKNVALPALLARAATPLIHVSTDGVFGDAAGAKTEDTLPNGTSLYARTKRAGEHPSAMVLRLSHVGPEPAPGRHLLARLANSGELPGFTNHLWNGVTTLAAAELIAAIVERGLFRAGIFHVTGESSTKAELMSALVAAFKLDCRVVPTRNAVDVDRRLQSVHAIGAGLLGASRAQQLDELVRWVRAPERCRRYPALTAPVRPTRMR